MFDTSGFWRWFDRAARVDFFGTLLGFFFDWKLWPPTGDVAMIAFLSGIAEGKSFFDVLVSTSIFAAAAAIIVIAILLLIRTMSDGAAPPDAHVAVDDWKNILDAIDAFADQTLVATKNRWAEKFDDTARQKLEAEEKINALSKPITTKLGPIAPGESSTLAQQHRLLEAATLGFELASDELRRAWTALREDIGRKLQSRELVAKGIPAPYVAGKSDVEISSHEWRLLELNPTAKAEAIEKGGGGIKYVAVVIGKVKVSHDR